MNKDNKRLEASLKCLEKLKIFLQIYPELRLEQALAIFDKGGDYFNEEEINKV